MMKKITVTIPSTFSDDTYKTVCDGFRRKFGDDCEFSKITDDFIIGGFIADVNGEIFDLSVSTQLRQLEKHILGETV